jgi:chromosome segregation ATPase
LLKVANLEQTLSQRDKSIAELEDNNGNLSGELTTTKDQLSSVRAAKKKIEEKAQTLSNELSDTREKLEEETKQKETLTQEHTKLKGEHENLILTKKQLEEKIDNLEMELRTLKEQYQAEKARLEGEISYLKSEIESEVQEKNRVKNSLNFEKGTVESLGSIIVTMKAGLKRANRQIKHERENTKLQLTSLRSSIEREMYLKMEVLKKALNNEWGVIKKLKEEKAELENDIEELEKRLEAVVQDLVNLEKELATETEAHWRTNDLKKAVEKQLATASQLFSALESKKERLEHDLQEKNREIQELK